MVKKLGMAISGRAGDVRKATQRIVNATGPKETIGYGILGFCATGILVTGFQERYNVKINHNAV